MISHNIDLLKKTNLMTVEESVKPLTPKNVSLDQFKECSSDKGDCYAIYVLQALGDLVVTSQIAKQLKHTDPTCHVVWFVLKKNAFVLKGHPFIDEIVELEGKNTDWDQRVQELKSLRSWKEFYIPQPHLAYEKCPGGDLVELVKAAVNLNWTVPYVPVLRLDSEEVSNARNYAASLGDGLKVLVETEFQSEQSPWNIEYAKKMIEALRHLNPHFIFSAKNEPPYLSDLRKTYSRIEWCQLAFRENAELYNRMDAFVGVSSGISCVSYSDWCRGDVPHVELVNNTHWSSYHFTHHSKRRLCFEEKSFDVSMSWLVKVLEKKISGAENPQLKRMDLYTLSREGKYTHFCKTILPTTYALKEDLRTMAVTLQDFPDFYLITGDIDDAMLTLSKALDENTLINVIVCSEHFDQLRSFFDEHSLIRNVYVIPYPNDRPETQGHLLVQMAFQKNCIGMGLKTHEPQLKGVFSDLRILELAKVKANPKWARRDTKTSATLRVVIDTGSVATKGFRSERALINPRWWQAMLSLLTYHGLRPIIIGDSSLSSVFSMDDSCVDLRNESRKTQINEVRDADLFIGSDSKFLFVASLCSVPSIRCLPMRGHDLAFYENQSMQSIRTDWKNFLSVATYQALEEQILSVIEKKTAMKSEWRHHALSTPISDLPRRTSADEELTSYHSVFWKRDYSAMTSLLVRCSTAVGDSLMITTVVHALKAQYPHLLISLSGTAATLEVFKHNPDVHQLLRRDSVEELLVEAVTDDVVEFNHIIDQFPEYYNGIHLHDILGNIAGVKLPNRTIHYSLQESESQFASACLQKVFGTAQPPFLVGLHLFTEKDSQRSYRHASGLLEYLNHLYPTIQFVNFGMTSFRNDYANVLDCAKYSNIGLREQIALASKCHLFISIDSAFFHIAHNLYKKPTLALQSVVNENLTGDPTLGNVRTVRNRTKGCKGCYWVPGVCKTECLPTLHPQEVAKEFKAMIEDLQANRVPIAVPTVLTDVVVEYDRCGKNMARMFRTNSGNPNNIGVAVYQDEDIMPSYVHQWNGVHIVDKNTIVENKTRTQDSIRKQKVDDFSLSWN